MLASTCSLKAPAPLTRVRTPAMNTIAQGLLVESERRWLTNVKRIPATPQACLVIDLLKASR